MWKPRSRPRHPRRIQPATTRRQLLKAACGAGGASLLLPLLPSLRMNRAIASGHFPQRVVILLSQHGTVYDRWRMRNGGYSDAVDYELALGALSELDFSEILRPLHRHRDQLLILDGLAMTTAVSESWMLNRHDTGWCHALTGARVRTVSAEEVSGAGGPSVDQIIAPEIALPDRFRSLEYAVGPEPYLFGAVHAAAGVPLPVVDDPYDAYERLFPPGSNPAPQPTVDDLVWAAQPSVLDFVADEYDAIASRLGQEDRLKLEMHRDEIRALEGRLEGLAGLNCQPPDAWTTTPWGHPDWYQDQAEAFFEIVAAALSCDLTRVITLQMGELPNNAFGAPPGEVHNDFAHYSDPYSETPPTAVALDAMTRYHQTHAAQLASLLDRLASIPEGSGTLLDNCAVVWVNELASGSHRFFNWPVVMAGSAGGVLRTGHYVRWAPTNPSPNPSYYDYINAPPLGPAHNQLWVSLCQAFGLDVNQVGDASVNVPGSGPADLTGILDRIWV